MDRCQVMHFLDIILCGSPSKSCSSRLFFWPPDKRTWTLRKPLHHESKMTGSMQVQFLKSFKDRKLASLKDRLAHGVSLHPMCINFSSEDPCNFGLFADPSFWKVLLQFTPLFQMECGRKGKNYIQNTAISRTWINQITPTSCEIITSLHPCTKRCFKRPHVFSMVLNHAWGAPWFREFRSPGGCRNSEYLGFQLEAKLGSSKKNRSESCYC